MAARPSLTTGNARMDEVADEGWERADVDASTPTPCCGRPVTLRSLIHESPLGFPRLTVDVWNPRPSRRTSSGRRTSHDVRRRRKRAASGPLRSGGCRAQAWAASRFVPIFATVRFHSAVGLKNTMSVPTSLSTVWPGGT